MIKIFIKYFVDIIVADLYESPPHKMRRAFYLKQTKMKGTKTMVKLQSQNEQITAFLSGDIDHHSACKMREQIDSDAQLYSPKLLCLDFKDVTFMDSSGIGLVMGRYKLISAMGGKIIITNCPNHIKKVMKLSGLEKLVEFKD